MAYSIYVFLQNGLFAEIVLLWVGCWCLVQYSIALVRVIVAVAHTDRAIDNCSNNNNTLHRMILQAERPTTAPGVI